MTQAYFRGLLKPGYEQGFRSYVRENHILTALAMENAGDTIRSVVQAEATLLGPHIDIQKSKDYIRNTNRRLRYAAEKKQLSILTMDEMFRTAEEAIMDLAKMYKEAEKSGAIEAFCKRIENILQKRQ